MTKRVLVCGAGGFIGSHLVKRLKHEGHWVRGVDLKSSEFSESPADEFIIGDLREQFLARSVIDQPFDEVYQLAADMGGAGYVFTGENDADIIVNSTAINVNVIAACKASAIKRIFFSSSACIYPAYNQEDPDNPTCAEDSAYPADPDSEYGREKLHAERMYLSQNRVMEVRVARYHNIFGPEGTWQGGREKAPAALCRKVALAQDGEAIEVWGDGQQTRSFLFIDECIEATLTLMRSDFEGPVNIGSEEMISINDLARMIISISGKNLAIENIPGPQGVRGRTSDNRLIRERLGWEPQLPLRSGIEKTYAWILDQVNAATDRQAA